MKKTLIVLLLVTSGLLLIFVQKGWAQQDETQVRRMYFKSQLGLMPPAYGASAEQQAHPVPAAPASAYFTSNVLYPSGSWPETTASGEWTGDGRRDVALSTSFDFDPANDQKVMLFAQTAGATLTKTQQVPIGAGSVTMARGDFNWDGLDDLVVANKDDNTLQVFIQSPTGTLTTVVTYTTGTAPDAIAVGDFNTDLRQDIAVSFAISQSVAVHYQQADGTLGAPVYIPVNSSGFNDLAVGDLNGDGKDDLVMLRGAGQTVDHVAVFYQQSYQLGGPTFLTVQTGGFQAHGLAVGDVTGDGRDDIVATAGGNIPNAYLNVIRQQVGGTMIVTPTVYAAYHLPETVEIGDVNHDGRNDVVLAHAAWLTLSTYSQKSDGTLNPYVADALPYTDFYRPGALTLSDVSNNGSLDAVLASHSSLSSQNGVIVLSNVTSGVPTSTIKIPALGASINITDTQPVTFTLQGLASTNAMTIEISFDGGQTWTARPISTAWNYTWNVPSTSRVYTVLARAITSARRVQSPPARTRIIVARTSYVYLPLVMR